MSCVERKQNPNELIHLFITRGASIGTTFTLMLLIQALIFLKNRHLHSDLLKNKALFMAYIGKTTFNIDVITIFFQVFLYHLIVKIYHH
jgi:hypothetical protein